MKDETKKQIIDYVVEVLDWFSSANEVEEEMIIKKLKEILEED